MLVCLCIKVGLPSTALYRVCRYLLVWQPFCDALAAPFLLAAHFFLVLARYQYYSSGRPSKLYGNKLLRADPMQTSWDAVRLALPGFIIPLFWFITPFTLMPGDEQSVISIGLMVISALVEFMH